MTIARNVTLHTNYWAKPIPPRQFDWSATLGSYEPGDPIGYGSTEADAVYDLFMQIEEREAEQAERSALEVEEGGAQ